MDALKKNTIIAHGLMPYDANCERSSRPQAYHLKNKAKDKLIASIKDVFDQIPIQSGMTLSFHHHLRNGDHLLNMVLAEIKHRKLVDMTLAPSAIFPIHAPMVELIKNGQITHIITNYINGPVAKAVSEGYLKGHLIMDTHGGRPRAIAAGELPIDVAFIATPQATPHGDGNGKAGPSACGALGYAIADMYYAKHKVVVTDHLVEHVDDHEIEGDYIDYVVVVDSLGDAKGIRSGTTQPTKDPIQLTIVKHTMELLKHAGVIKNGMSFQTGAGGTSIAVAKMLNAYMTSHQIHGSFASGGITTYLVDMLENGLFERLYDVQCFDLRAVESYQKNANHLKMSASEYADPNHPNPIVNALDVVILGATEVDLDFNVNVTTDSNGYLMGGSGGHSDTAHGAKLTIVTTNLIKTRLPIIQKQMISITTPGQDVDVIVTERGIAINPLREDLIRALKGSNLPIMTIEALYQKAISMTGIPQTIKRSLDVIGFIRYRDGSIIDVLYKVGA